MRAVLHGSEEAASLAPNASSSVSLKEIWFTHKASRQKLFAGLSLHVKPGEILSIMGPSGCGKSTLLDLIAGLLTPEAGLISVSGASNSVGYIFQRDALMPWRTVKDNLMLARQLKKVNVSEETMYNYMQCFNLGKDIDKLFPHQLSGGMRQRISIIQTLMFNPRILLLDEPFSALDLHTKLQLQTEFHKIAKETGKTAIIVSHDVDEAIAVSDRVIVLNKKGQIADEVAVQRTIATTPDMAREQKQFSELYHDIRLALQAVMANEE